MESATEAAGPRPGQGHDLRFGLVLVGCLLLPWAVAWLMARPGGRAGVFVVVLVGIFAVVLAIVEGRARRRRRWAIAVSAAGVVAMAVLAALELWTGPLVRVRMQAGLDQLTAVIAQEDAGQLGCRSLPDGVVEVPGVGTVDQVCVVEPPIADVFVGSAEPRQEEPHWLFRSADSPVELISASAPTTFAADCLAPLGDGWWEALDQASCPPGFTSDLVVLTRGYAVGHHKNVEILQPWGQWWVRKVVTPPRRVVRPTGPVSVTVVVAAGTWLWLWWCCCSRSWCHGRRHGWRHGLGRVLGVRCCSSSGASPWPPLCPEPAG